MDKSAINEFFPNEQVLFISHVVWYVNLVNFLVSSHLPHKLNSQQRKMFLHEACNYVWSEPYLFRLGADQVLRRCIHEEEQEKIIGSCHDSQYGGHYGGTKTTSKILQANFYWLTAFKDSFNYISKCNRCQRIGNISRRNEMPLNNNLEVELFDVWEIDSMGPFLSSYNNRYILLTIDSNDSNVVLRFLKKHIFTRFGTPRAIISDEGSHFVASKLRHC